MPMMPIYRNPLWRKSVQSRMRWTHLLSWGVVTLTFTTFVSLLIYFTQTEQFDVPPRDAAKAVIPAVLIIQSVLLMFFGTGAVSYGISMERDENLVDYQRMTPMSPNQKILGYLFGLPAREYVLFALTMPFVIVAALYSGFSFLTLLHFYMVFFLSVWVYHMTGLTAGMVSPMPRMTAIVSMGMVVVLYFVLPNLSRLGITFFEHLTIRPTLFGLVWNELPLSMRPRAEMSGIDGFRPIPWFGGSMHQTIYTVIVQVFVIGVMYSVVRRKWVRADSHLFSKAGGVVVFGGILVFLLSSLWAMIVQDEVYQSVFVNPFQSVEVTDEGRVLRTMGNPNAVEVERNPQMLMVLLMISLSLVGAMFLMMTSWITSGRSTAVEGWRRSKKRGWRGLGWNTDATSSLPACLLMIAMTLVAGWLILDIAGERHAFFEEGPAAGTAFTVALAMLGCGMFVQGTCERLGGLVFAIGMFMLWIIPVFAGIIVGAAFGHLEAAMLISLPCPPVTLMAAVSVMMDSAVFADPAQQHNFTPPADQFQGFVPITMTGVYGYLAAGVGAQVWRVMHRRKLKRIGTSEEVVKAGWLDTEDVTDKPEEW